MDPTEEELNNMETIDDVADWAGLEGPLKEGLLKDLGTPTKLRDIAFITRPVWDAALVLLRVDRQHQPIQATHQVNVSPHQWRARGWKSFDGW